MGSLRREADHHPSVLDAHLEGGLIVAKSRVGHVASGAELERVLMARAHHGALLLVQPATGKQAAGVVAGVVHGGDPPLVAREQHQPLPNLEAAEHSFDQIGRLALQPTLLSCFSWLQLAASLSLLGEWILSLILPLHFLTSTLRSALLWMIP